MTIVVNEETRLRNMEVAHEDKKTAECDGSWLEAGGLAERICWAERPGGEKAEHEGCWPEMGGKAELEGSLQRPDGPGEGKCC